VQPTIDDIAYQRHDDILLLEDPQDLANRLDGVERLGHAGGATHVDLLGITRRRMGEGGECLLD
jgi:hypothetical protein